MSQRKRSQSGGDEARERAHRQTQTRPADGADPADYRAPDRRRTEEGDRPERHDSPTHLGIGRQLEGRVGHREERDAPVADQRQGHQLQCEDRCQGRKGDRHPEPGRGNDQGSLPSLAPSGGHQAPGHRPDAHAGRHDAVGLGATMKDMLRGVGQRDLELVGQHADQRHHEQRDAQLRSVGHVAEPCSELTTLAGGRRARA